MATPSDPPTPRDGFRHSHTHCYEDATVQIAVDESLLKKSLHYFVTRFEGPWLEATADGVIRLRDITKQDFTLFLDVIYEPLSDMSFLRVPQAFALFFISEYFQAHEFRDAARAVLERRPKHWGNIRDFMEALSKHPSDKRFERLRAECVTFLISAMDTQCVQVLFYAEAYGFDELLADDFTYLWPHDAYHDPYFRMLSPGLQIRVFFDIVQAASKCTDECHCAGCPVLNSPALWSD
ncbi:uncharacterized protein EV422DRAFT_571974 [Fimicolochytrium jonesii]|uniref:uncharacterized protein n=1 Tax=Fimicolochytrium jonesii TaxID=1396493 RepID=UPI0022FF1AA2|nr:uncharacterized protein EV422DRAFT_571974 [Fimicolochytrium jonesii]KAI8816233.1 hypothetical protein EV422DRAFT_571974 [Fimicolochytrium jonesii]